MKGIFINAEGKENLEGLIKEFQEELDSGELSEFEEIEYESAIDSYQHILDVATFIP